MRERGIKEDMSHLPTLWPQRVFVARVKVCAASGNLPNRRCPHSAWIWFVPGRSTTSVCGAHPGRADQPKEN